MSNRTAVNQIPSGGTVYPFVSATGLTDAFLDFYLSYEDDSGQFAGPFTLTVALSGSDFTIAVTDQTNQDVLGDVLSSLVASTTDWGTDRRVYEWVTDTRVVRVVASYGNVAGLSELTGILDPRTCDRVPGRVRSITVNNQVITGQVAFRCGYNVDMATTDKTQRDGGRRVSRVTMGAVPGSGLGRLTGCSEVIEGIRTINGQVPSQTGNFLLEADDCYRIELPLTMYDTPRRGAYEYTGMTVAEARAALLLFNDCRPCCSCTDYVNVYLGLKSMWNRWKDAATAAEAVRDTFEANKARWLDQKTCREAQSLRTVAQSLFACKLFVGANYCNITNCCFTNFEIRFTFQLLANGEPADWPTSSVLNAYIDSSYTHGKETYTPVHAGAVFRFMIDSSNPGSSTIVAMQLCVACQPESDDPNPPILSVKMTTTVHIPDPLEAHDGSSTCVLEEQDIPLETASIWTANGLPSSPAVRAVDAAKHAPLNPALPVRVCCNNCE